MLELRGDDDVEVHDDDAALELPLGLVVLGQRCP